MRLVIFVVGGSLLLMAVLIFVSSGDQTTRGEIEIAPLQYDGGTISMAAGPVSYTYEIKNSGQEDLKIDRIWTSCMCTTARLKVGDQESGEFGMHTVTTLWSQKLAPGQTGFLTVTFDPAYHGPAGVGEAVRAVYIANSDPNNQKAEVRLTANVIP